MRPITAFFKPAGGAPRPPLAPPSADELASARRKAFDKLFVSRTGADSGAKRVGRPTNATQALYDVCGRMREVYRTYTGPLSLDEWWSMQPELAALPAVSSAAAAAPAAAAAAAAAGEVDASGAPSGMDVMVQQEHQKHGYRNEGIRLLYQALMHKWAMDGSHTGFYTATEFSGRVFEFLGHGPLAPSTAHRWLKREKDDYDAGLSTALRQKPNITQLLLELEEARARVKEMRVPPPDPDGHGAIMAQWYSELAAAVTPLTALPGFGPHIVCGVAASLFSKKTDGEEWIPSEDWARYFMHTHMKLTVRRVTGHITHPAAVEKQQQLHDINLNIISLAFADEGLQPDDIYFMDEIGAFSAVRGDCGITRGVYATRVGECTVSTATTDVCACYGALDHG